jgi:uncharacterized membrane protein YfcA
MNGQLTLYRDQYGIVPVALSLIAILWTTIVLIAVHSMMDDDSEHLALAYLLPTIFIAIFFGSTLASASERTCRCLFYLPAKIQPLHC